MTDAGFLVSAGAGEPRLIPLPLEMPSVSWAQGAVRDAETGTLYGVTLGGDGLLYAYDEATEVWRIVRSMGGLDAHALFLDTLGRRLIMPLGLTQSGQIAIIDLSSGENSPLQIVDLGDTLVGLTDLYDPGNGPAPDIVPVAIDGDRLLLVARDDRKHGRSFPNRGDSSPVWRAWLADLSTSSVALVGYGNGQRKE